MLTLHRVTTLLADPTAPPVTDGAVLVQGTRIAGLGPYAELAGAFPAARTRRWDGLLTPGLRNPCGHWLLECAYHPDPREEIGAEPVPGLELDETQAGASARRGLQRMLGYGTTAVAGPFERPAVRTAVARSGLTALPGEGLAGPLDPLATATLAQAAHGRLTIGGPADFAVFEASGPAGPAVPRAGGALATVLAGRLVFRRH
ncbi:imidazolonepropionase-like domain-containing protein [Kitasatospora sp. NPDC050543]|uniref:amidohydrolase family protein n=1 Tax=Kitasatospora sp. NPDC050543 TaxID=3364054 RepID=UPI0037BBFE9C